MNRIKKIKLIRNKLKSGKSSIGSWMQTADTNIAEIMGKLNYDWITIDLEHGSASLANLPDLFRSIDLGYSLPLARLASANKEDSKKALDAGAGGLIFPNIETGKQLIEIISASCWPPTGIRSVGFSRANLYGEYFDEYKKEAQSPLIIAMIESLKGLDNLEEILRTPGLDAVMVGPYDLSASLQITGDFENKIFKDALRYIAKTSKAMKIPVGIHQVEPSLEELKEKIKKGYQFLAYSIDTVFINKLAKNPLQSNRK